MFKIGTNWEKSITFGQKEMEQDFTHETTDLGGFLHPYSGERGVIIRVLRGSANVTMALESKELRAGDEVFLLPRLPFCVLERSADFQAEMIRFHERIYREARHGLSPQLEMHLRQSNLHHHHRGDSHEENFQSFMSMAKTIATERDNEHVGLMQTAFLKIYLLYLFDKCQGKWTRRQAAPATLQYERFYKFMDLLDIHCRREHTVAFYASALAISPRYLSMIVHDVTAFSSAKDVIDQRRILEIKSLLTHTAQSQQQIASEMHCPDVSYLGRYFRRHTGLTPSQYRNQAMATASTAQ